MESDFKGERALRFDIHLVPSPKLGDDVVTEIGDSISAVLEKHGFRNTDDEVRAAIFGSLEETGPVDDFAALLRRALDDSGALYILIPGEPHG